MAHQPPAIACSHEIRAGTAVCLYCRREARQLSRARLHRRGMWGVLTVAALGGVVAVMPGGAHVLQGVRSATAVGGAVAVPAAVMAGESAAASGSAAAAAGAAPAERERAAPPERAALTAAGVALVSAPTAPWRDATALPQPVVPEGATPLRGGMMAVRAGDTVTVRFDLPGWRTRRADKFERAVRATLPLVYGRAADALLARTAPGSLAAPGTLLTELPRRGIRLPLADGSSLVLWPGLRPSSGGPLVVMYRASVVR